MGDADKFLEDLGSDIPRNQFFGKVVLAKVVQHVKLGWFKVFPDIQDHLAEVQRQRHQGVGQEQGHPQKYFLGELRYQELLRMITLVF